jgi:hypothetical protein
MSETPANSTLPDDSAEPIPPRYWWLKRILLAVGVLILALAALRWWWGYEAQRRLQAKIDEYHALGQPVTIEDFQFPPVPDEENAAHFLVQAASALVRPPIEDAVAEELCSYPEGVPEHADAVARWVATNGETLRLVHEARGKNGIDWGLRYTSPVINITFPSFSSQRALARFLCATALLQHQKGDDASAVDTLRGVLFQAEAVGQEQGFLISHLVAMAIDALGVNTLEAIMPTLPVGEEDSAGRPGALPASRAQVDDLIADLLDEAALRQSWLRAMWGERLFCLDSVNAVVTTPGAPGAIAMGAPNLARPLGWLLKPMFQLDAIFMMDFCTACAEAGLSRDYQRAKSMAPGFPTFESNIERNSHLLSWDLLPALGSCLRQHFYVLAYRRLAATALAIRLYEFEHEHRPHALNELVPDYIPAIPLDPFSADGAPIGYRPDADPPVLYSVGDDGVDDGGEFAVTDFGTVDRESKDWVFFLNGDRPRTPPPSLATQPAGAEAVEDEGDEVGGGGGNDDDQSNADQP